MDTNRLIGALRRCRLALLAALVALPLSMPARANDLFDVDPKAQAEKIARELGEAGALAGDNEIGKARDVLKLARHRIESQKKELGRKRRKELLDRVETLSDIVTQKEDSLIAVATSILEREGKEAAIRYMSETVRPLRVSAEKRSEVDRAIAEAEAVNAVQRQAQREKQAREQARRAIDNGKTPDQITDPVARMAAQRLYRERQDSIQAFQDSMTQVAREEERQKKIERERLERQRREEAERKRREQESIARERERQQRIAEEAAQKEQQRKAAVEKQRQEQLQRQRAEAQKQAELEQRRQAEAQRARREKERRRREELARQREQERLAQQREEQQRREQEEQARIEAESRQRRARERARQKEDEQRRERQRLARLEQQRLEREQARADSLQRERARRQAAHKASRQSPPAPQDTSLRDSRPSANSAVAEATHVPAADKQQNRNTDVVNKENANRYVHEIYALIEQGRGDIAFEAFSKQKALLQRHLSTEVYDVLESTVSDSRGSGVSKAAAPSSPRRAQTEEELYAGRINGLLRSNKVVAAHSTFQRVKKQLKQAMPRKEFKVLKERVTTAYKYYREHHN
jgi:hypothetical protein